MLQTSFFPEQRTADLTDITPDYLYPEPVEMPDITSHEVQQAIKNMAIGKALGPDLMLAEILKKAIKPRDNGDKEQEPTPFHTALTRLFNASWNLGYYLRAFRTSTTVAL